MGCGTGTFTASALAQLDRQKTYHRSRKSSSDEQKSRKVRRAEKKGFRDAAELQSSKKVLHIMPVHIRWVLDTLFFTYFQRPTGRFLGITFLVVEILQ